MATQQPFDKLQKMSFRGISFLVERVTVKGGIEHHVHKYPHTPGGKPEKLGRKLYTVACEGVFAVGVKEYPDAWPDDLGALRTLFEQEVTDNLVIPTVGTIKAFAIDWDQEMSNKMRNGEKTHFTFLEDNDQDLLVETLLVQQNQSTKLLADNLTLAAIDAGFPADFFASIQQLANEIATLQDQADTQAELLAEKAGALGDLCRTADATVKKLNEPPAWKVVVALHELGVAADALNRDVLRKAIPLSTFPVPFTMTISSLSRLIYSDTSRAIELMSLNPFEDIFAIPAGMVVRHYPLTSPLPT